MPPGQGTRYTRQDLIRQLADLGLRNGQLVMVHASVRSAGFLYGGPDEIHLAIQEAIAPEGTMMMVVGCPEGSDEVTFSTISQHSILQRLAPIER
jgi:aminoglycoside 3-N-acetyltransferase